ncbi:MULTISPECIES: phage/plasmid primase, P4 family [Streptomyces]|uniref:DNA primase n=1 Tax=Streptomyces nanshensis TaxID=518642 RepID=A0A1E7LPN9_9ACTN|nr:phage/plasmid primase, P4 family [Streptomyces nanshensis]OEV18172.1 DNA primase [Streptomyces nanshensis]
MEFRSILARFEDVAEHADGGYVARCAGHSDTRPSLRIWRGEDNKVRMTCRANCRTADVLTGAGLTFSDLFDATGEGLTVPAARPVPVDAGKIAALRMWLDDRLAGLGASVYDYAAKRFGLNSRQLQDLEVGSWVPSAEYPEFVSDTFARYPRMVVPFFGFDGVARGAQGRDLSGRCPVRWVSLSNDGGTWAKYGVLRNRSGFDTWVITEGPSDGLTAWAQGYNVVAVRGAGLARNAELIREIAAGLGDSDVVLAGDRDKAGEAFTEELAKALVREGVMVRRLAGIPPGMDLTDWRAEAPTDFPGAFHHAVRRAELVKADEPAGEVTHRGTSSNAPLPLTDLGNAQRLFNRLGGHVRMVAGAGVFRWQGRKWEQIPTEALYADVRAVIRAMGEETGHPNPDAHSKWVQRSQDAQKVRGMVDMLSSIPGVYATVDQFDATPDQIAFRNGMVSLRTGELTPHDPEDMNTFYVDVDFKPGARAPRWERFLQECHPDSESTPGFLQELVGYGLSGLSVERCFVMHVGPTTNGKTTFTATLEDVFGDAAHRVDAALFQRRRESGGPRADVVGLRGKRLVISSEWPAHMPLDQALMKSVTGDQTISARGVYARNEITFRPSCLVQVDTNYVPDVDATDAALWQRVRVVPWEQDFRGREDRHLQSTLKREREGIAAWAVAGAVRWFAKYESGKGLEFPSAVEKRTAHYRDASHPLSGFIGEEYEVAEGGFVSKTETWDRYRSWVEECGIRHPMTRNKFYDATRTFPGVMETARNGKRGFKNLRDCNAPEAKAGPGIFGGGH